MNIVPRRLTLKKAAKIYAIGLAYGYLLLLVFDWGLSYMM